ncbi:MAG: hypothetical protein KJO98_08925 [Rhodothermia bacterium]|nr:hypothetical protein [Rhodothermia bacterium]
MQVLYAFIAMLLIALLSLTLQRGVHSTERRQIVNEVATQLVGVGIDVVEYIGRHPFDAQTDTTDPVVQAKGFPFVEDPSELTPPGSFGGCADYYSCGDIDDFHGMNVARTVDGIDYSVDIEVEYVDDDSPETASATQTYSKEVRLEIASPHLYVSSRDNPITVVVARVFSYDQPTKE